MAAEQGIGRNLDYAILVMLKEDHWFFKILSIGIQRAPWKVEENITLAWLDKNLCAKIYNSNR